MRQREIIKFFLRSMVLCPLLLKPSAADTLSPSQKAPLFARGSGDVVLQLPFGGETIDAVSPPAKNNDGSGLKREEISSIKKVGDTVVQVVKGSLAYNSPEGLPVSVIYSADENGNKVSFKIGTGTSEFKKVVKTESISDSSHSPPTENGNTEDRSYLPPN